MKKVLVIGICGAGKTTLARALSKELDLPLYNMDEMFWGPEWTPSDNEAFDERVRKVCGEERWIIEGTYSRNLPMRLKEADTVIDLRLPLPWAMYRVLRRTAGSYGKTRPAMAEDCPERFDWEFLKYVATFPWKKRPGIDRMIESHKDGLRYIPLNGPREIRFFLKSLSTKVRHA